MSESDEVFLEIEGTLLNCSRRELAAHSDYFKVMFEGDFVEKGKKTVKLKDVSLKAMNIILTLFWDERYFVHEKDLLLVLEAACMLQFTKIKNMCIENILNNMNTSNCFEVWRTCEFLDIKPLYVKAKAKALMEFTAIAKKKLIYRLDLEWFCRYVANRNLECKSEMEVYQACMHWWYENCDNCENVDEVLFVLLGCLDFKALSINDIGEMKSYPDIMARAAVIDTLDCVIGLKQNAILHYDDAVLSRAKIFYESKSRIVRHCPCFIIILEGEKYYVRQEKVVLHFCDRILRKRKYGVLHNLDRAPLTFMFYDPRKDKIKKLLEMDNQKLPRFLNAYKIVAYKEKIYLFGGQYERGSREFARSVWMYDTYREKWTRSTLIPYCRRDFDVCLSGSHLFIVGGSGQYISVQNNLFWYNCTEDLWGEKVDLPVHTAGLKLCAYKNNQLLLVSTTCSRAYLFDPSSKQFIRIELCGEITSMFTEEFTVFNYKDHIYFKGTQLVKTKIDSHVLRVVESSVMNCIPHCIWLESVLSDKILYTYYVHSRDEGLESRFCTLEKFHVETHETSYILDSHNLWAPIHVEGTDYYLKQNPNMFLFQHYAMVDEDEFVNDYILNVKNTLFTKE